MNKIKIVILGGSGQLASCFVDILNNLTDKIEFISFPRSLIDITDKKHISTYLANKKPDYLINCAAYTDVAGAESSEDQAILINGYGPKILAECCKEYNVRLIHFSTDYVFDGSGDVKTEDSETHPLNTYGRSKLLGEKEILDAAENSNLEYMIIRTSWLYSEYGKNFVKTIINKALNGEEMHIVEDQIGSPTYAGDLARFVINDVILGSSGFVSGIYNYSNEGITSWYDFAIAAIDSYTDNYYDIKGEYPIQCAIYPIYTDVKAQKVNRPKIGILSKEKVVNTYHTIIPYWRPSLNYVTRKLITDK